MEYCFRFRFRPASRHQHIILHRRTKFHLNRRHWRPSYDVISVFKMADVSHVVCHVRLGWTTHDVWVSSSNSGLIGCMVSEILRFLDLGNLAWKCLFTPLFGMFWGTFPKTMSLIVLTPKGPSLGRTTWPTKREYRPSGSSSHKQVIFHPFGEKSHALKRSLSEIV